MIERNHILIVVAFITGTAAIFTMITAHKQRKLIEAQSKLLEKQSGIKVE